MMPTFHRVFPRVFGVRCCLKLNSIEWTYQRWSRFYSLIKQSAVADLSQQIDLEKMKEKRLRLVMQGEKANIHKMVEQELEKLCGKAINDFPEDKLRNLKAIQHEHFFMYCAGFDIPAPQEITNKQWLQALTQPSKDERLQQYLFLGWKFEMKRMDREGEVERKLPPEAEDRDGEDPSGIIYHPRERFNDSRWGNHCLASSMQFGLPVVIDMDYDHLMTQKEIGGCAKQLWKLYSANRSHPQPFHLVFASCPNANILLRTMELQHLLDCYHFLATQTAKSYLDLYNHDDLVYLTPHSPVVMTEFDPSKVYILGAYSEQRRQRSRKRARTRAKEHDVPALRFPIDENIKWVYGDKDLPLDDALRILLSVRDTGDWKTAFASTISSKRFNPL